MDRATQLNDSSRPTADQRGPTLVLRVWPPRTPGYWERRLTARPRRHVPNCSTTAAARGQSACATMRSGCASQQFGNQTEPGMREEASAWVSGVTFLVFVAANAAFVIAVAQVILRCLASASPQAFLNALGG